MAHGSVWVRCQSVAHQMARKGHAKGATGKGRTFIPGYVSPELAEACKMLGRGDEAEMKGFLLRMMADGYDTLSGNY